MITPNAGYRPNPERAIYITGEINQGMVDLLTPQIISLLSKSRDPITVYIDSPGGNVRLMEALLGLLVSSDQDYGPACRLITVVTSRAASAAADILSSGDYALAFPHSTILYHGQRLSPQEQPLTFEFTSLLADFLRRRNDKYALELAQKVEDRFMFRFVSCKRSFDSVRQSAPKQMTDLDCFIEMILEKISPNASKVLRNARQRYERYQGLLDSAARKYNSERYKNKRAVEFEAYLLKSIIDFQSKATNQLDAAWTFESDGLSTLIDDFFLLFEYLRLSDSERFRRQCSRWHRFLLDTDELEAIDRLPEADRADRIIELVSPLLKPVWQFFLALCHALQQGENDLVAKDAFWLGLVDEVIGMPWLPTRRWIYEYVPDPRPDHEAGTAAVPVEQSSPLG